MTEFPVYLICAVLFCILWELRGLRTSVDNLQQSINAANRAGQSLIENAETTNRRLEAIFMMMPKEPTESIDEMLRKLRDPLN
jgi:hypothetical protein